MGYRGLRDGFSLDGKKIVGPQPNGHGLALTAQEAAMPCSCR